MNLEGESSFVMALATRAFSVQQQRSKKRSHALPLRTRSNETELSHRWQNRALPEISVF